MSSARCSWREREKERERERDLEQERTRERNKEKETEDKEKQRSRLIKEKNDKINIDEWTTNPSDIKHPTLTSIKEKLRQKEEEEEADNKRRKEQQMEEDKKQKWSNICFNDTDNLKVTKILKKLPPNLFYGAF